MIERLNKQLPVLPTRSSVGSRPAVGRATGGDGNGERGCRPGETASRRRASGGGIKAEKRARRRLKMESNRSLWHRSLARQSRALPVLGSPQALSCYTRQAEHQKCRRSHPPPGQHHGSKQNHELKTPAQRWIKGFLCQSLC